MSMDNCKAHGWWEVTGLDKCPICEIARLHAEMESLQRGWHEEVNMLVEKAKRLTAEVEQLKKAERLTRWPWEDR